MDNSNPTELPLSREARTEHPAPTRAGASLSLRAALPIAVLAIGALAGLGLVTITPRAAQVAHEVRLTLIPTAPLAAGTSRVIVDSQGTVVPRTESELVAEVTGRVIEVSPALVSGGFFEAGDVLARIDDTDYALIVERAESARERAASELELARVTSRRRESLARDGAASAAALDEARSRERVARAALKDAGAALEQARRDLERTRIVAPFAGRVREKRLDLGEFVSRGAPVARIYAVDYAEIRLPIPDREAGFLDLPYGYRAAADPDAAVGPAVLLRARFAGREHTWPGRIVRTEGEIDPRTRMLHAVARVEDPYGRWAYEPGAPLAVGLFVHAEIEGRPIEEVFDLPRSALHGDRALVIDADDRVRLRKVEVVRTRGDRALVRGALAPGDRLPLAPLAVPVDGTQVRTEDGTPTTMQGGMSLAPQADRPLAPPAAQTSGTRVARTEAAETEPAP